jgi:hypothetical protein
MNSCHLLNELFVEEEARSLKEVNLLREKRLSVLVHYEFPNCLPGRNSNIFKRVGIQNSFSRVRINN